MFDFPLTFILLQSFCLLYRRINLFGSFFRCNVFNIYFICFTIKITFCRCTGRTQLTKVAFIHDSLLHKTIKPNNRTLLHSIRLTQNKQTQETLTIYLFDIDKLSMTILTFQVRLRSESRVLSSWFNYSTDPLLAGCVIEKHEHDLMLILSTAYAVVD